MASNGDTQNGKRGPAGIDEVNLTPLIDVSLVLVVILMVAMPMVFQSSIAVRKAALAGQAAADPVRTERVEIAIVSEDSLRVNRTMFGRDQLRGALFALLAGSATGTVVVECAGSVSHGTFVHVLDDAKACGATQISVLGE